MPGYVYKCKQCGHEWVGKSQRHLELRCPKCKALYWGIPKKAPK